MNAKSTVMLIFGALPHLSALAHEGHGLAGTAHWHATDTLGFIGAAVVAAAVWFIGRRK